MKSDSASAYIPPSISAEHPGKKQRGHYSIAVKPCKAGQEPGSPSRRSVVRPIFVPVLLKRGNQEFNDICGINKYIPPKVIERRSYSYNIDECEFKIFCY